MATDREVRIACSEQNQRSAEERAEATTSPFFFRASSTRCENEDEQPPPSDPSRLLAVFRAVPAGTQPICRTPGSRWTGPASPAAGNYYLLTPLITYSSWGDAPPVGHPPAKPPDDYRVSGAGHAGTAHYGGRGPGYSHNPRVVGRTPPDQPRFAFPLKEHTGLCYQLGKKRKFITTNQIKYALPFVAISVSTETEKHDSNITHLCTQAWEASSGVHVALGGDTTLQIGPMGLDSLPQTFAVVVSDIIAGSANRSMSYTDVNSTNISTFGHEEMIHVTCHVDARGETYRHVFTAPVSGTPDGTVCVEKTTRTVARTPGDTTEKMTQQSTTKPITLTTRSLVLDHSHRYIHGRGKQTLDRMACV
ncbi:hypothetical protein Bbelb_117700 [Branchiostoma belcheri]|nr:hypothetical protein Bbelb_117700 [Branchiostoma belcheri]